MHRKTPLLTLSYLLGSFFLNSGSAAPPKQINLGLGSAVTLSELIVNTGEQHYSFKRSRRDGEQDLYRRCLDSTLEEAWVFVRYSNYGEWWHEAGENENEAEKTASLGLTQKHLAPPETIEEISLYHFHSDKITGKGFASETPSLKDITDGAIKAADFVKSVSPELLGKLEFKIVVSSGIYTMRVDVKALEDQAVLKETLDTARSMEDERWKVTLGTSEFDYSPGNRVNFPRLNQEFARRYSSGGVKLEFVPK
ncbi:hypothetical protein HZC30_00895 [Candidatus Woesearchaeota archaeon]|nr:hypothetical protein [Candidatus Woesearchaeota archaeon]